MPKKCVNFKKL